MKRIAFLMLLLFPLTAGCQRLYNATLENVFGFEKRQLLEKSVQAVKGDQVKAQEEFKDALTELKKLYGYDGGNLEKMYNRFKSRYEDSQEQAEKVHERIGNMERIAKSMFSEWSDEIKDYENKDFARDSRAKLESTKERYGALIKSAREAEAAMPPILRKLNDHVLYLKHNLNAASVGALEGEAADIQSDVEELANRMNDSIREADNFIRMLGSG